MRCYIGKNIAFWKLILKIPLCQWSDWGKRNYWWINAVHLHLWQVASVPSALSVISLRVWRGGGRRPAWWWYDGAVSRAGLVPCLHCVLLLSTDVHIHTLPTATPSPEQRFLPASRHQSRPGSARRLGKPKWTEKLDPDCRHRVPLQISGAWHRAGTGTAVLCPLLPPAPGVYWKNVNYEFTCKLGGVPLIVNTRHYVTGCPKCPRSSVHRGMSQYARWYGHCTRNIFFNKCFFLPDVASHYSSPLPSDQL